MGLGIPGGANDLGVAGGVGHMGGEASPIAASLNASQLERRVKELALSTIQSYGSNPEETAAEESWDYAQFQVRGPIAPSPGLRPDLAQLWFQ